MRTTIEIGLEQVVCPFCGEAKHHPLFAEGQFQMVRCALCRFIYLNPRPTKEALLCFYQDYLPKDDASVSAWQSMMESVFQRAGTLIEQYKKRGKLVDVGAGFGFFLSEMKKRGWDVSGVEISQKAIDYAKDVLGIPLQLGPLEEVGFPEGHFDVVSGFYVIEHLPQPIEFLKECFRILKPDGMLLLRYPHTTPIKNFLKFLGIQNRLYDLPAHLSDFSPGMIQRCLEKVGFKTWKHLIGGHTFPKGLGKRWASSFFGNLSEVLFYLSQERVLLPGVSKTVLAFKG